jgi:hypothetical protein
VLAYLDDHRARYPYDATGVIADLPAAYDNGLLPHHELLEDDLRAVLAEREADVRAVASLLRTWVTEGVGAGRYDPLTSVAEHLEARFAGRIEALEARETKVPTRCTCGCELGKPCACEDVDHEPAAHDAKAGEQR